MEKVIPQIGHHVEPDGWRIGENLEASDGWSDSLYPGCQFRLPCHAGCIEPQAKLGINITVTGNPHYLAGSRISQRHRSRIKIEIVGDGEPSTFTGGWLYHQ